jgi:hypothetical protein
MKTIELIYDADCPNIGEARARLADACRSVGRPPEWIEWERSSPGTPFYATEYGSPTILVNGRDVTGDPEVVGGTCCRIYAIEGAFAGVPPLSQLVEALGREF